MNLSDFDFNLPESLIAQYPAEERQQSRLLVANRQQQSIQDKQFSDLLNFLQEGDLLVFNNSKTMMARLYGYRQTTGGKIELLVEKIINPTTAKVLIKSNKKIKPGLRFMICNNFNSADDKGLLNTQSMGSVGSVGSEEVSGQVLESHPFSFTVEFSQPVSEVLRCHGEVPLPPYIKRPAQPFDRERYQTVYAKTEGSVATPTAGLHFTPELLAELEARKIAKAWLMLHVGLGTFLPVRAEQIEDHQMHDEFLEISAETCRQIEHCKQQGGRVIAVGTTSVRALETMMAVNRNLTNPIAPITTNTQLFMYPGKSFQLVDGMITNFHLPQSTLFMLISAFCGLSFAHQCYQHAIDQKYRFFSYGDSMLIL